MILFFLFATLSSLIASSMFFDTSLASSSLLSLSAFISAVSSGGGFRAAASGSSSAPGEDRNGIVFSTFSFVFLLNLNQEPCPALIFFVLRAGAVDGRGKQLIVIEGG